MGRSVVRVRVPLLVVMLGFAPLAGTAQEAPAYSFDDDELVIVGEVQKPEVTVVISRENLNKAYELELKESFLPKIVESVEKPPF